MQIPSSSFQAASLLSSIIFKRNKLKEIFDYAFHGLLRLPYLDLSAQDLQIIGNYGFVSLSHLLSLDLSFNKLKVVKAEWFMLLNKLIYLYLNDNDILMIDQLLFNIMLKLRSVDTSQPALCCLTSKQLLCVVDSVKTALVYDQAITSTTVRIIAILSGGTIILCPCTSRAQTKPAMLPQPAGLASAVRRDPGAPALALALAATEPDWSTFHAEIKPGACPEAVLGASQTRIVGATGTYKEVSCGC